jgi:hypothetical protein
MRMRQVFEESMCMLLEDLKEEIEVYDSFFSANEMKPHEDQRWKEMLEEHRYMKNLHKLLLKQLDLLDQI